MLKIILPLLLLLLSPNALLAVEQASKNQTIDYQSRFTAAEKRWLRAHPVLRHGVVSGHKPFEYIDENKLYRGLTSDYVAIIADQLNIQFETVVFDTFAELGLAISNNDIHLSSYLPPYWEDFAIFSEPVIRMPIVMFARQDASLVIGLSAIDTERVIVERPSRAEEILSRDFPSMSLSYVSTPSEGITAVVEGEADIFIHNVFSVEYYQRIDGLEQLKVVGQTPYEFDIKFAVHPSMAPLIPIIQKVISGLSVREQRLIFDKWVNIELQNSTDIRQIVASVISIFALISLLFAIVLRWNTLLQREVDERTREIENSSQQLRELARHMERVREEEKTKLAREIHDELGHSLTAINMGVRKLRQGFLKHPQTANATAIPQLTAISEVIRDAALTSRRIMSDLRPSVLEDLGLGAAIEWLAHEFENNYGIKCRLQVSELLQPLSDEVATALFRIIQESLTNIAKHSKAENAQIIMTCGEDWLTIQIQDDGVGLDVSRPSNAGSFGVQGMHERALACGGELSLTNSVLGGASLRVQIPLSTIS